DRDRCLLEKSRDAVLIHDAGRHDIAAARAGNEYGDPALGDHAATILIEKLSLADVRGKTSWERPEHEMLLDPRFLLFIELQQCALDDRIADIETKAADQLVRILHEELAQMHAQVTHPVLIEIRLILVRAAGDEDIARKCAHLDGLQNLGDLGKPVDEIGLNVVPLELLDLQLLLVALIQVLSFALLSQRKVLPRSTHDGEVTSLVSLQQRMQVTEHVIQVRVREAEAKEEKGLGHQVSFKRVLEDRVTMRIPFV